MSMTGTLRQWGTLTRGYLAVLSRDKFNLLILFGQAPIIAFLTYLVVGAKSPRDFPYFMLALVAIWFRSEEHTSELQSHLNLVCRLLLEKKKKKKKKHDITSATV